MKNHIERFVHPVFLATLLALSACSSPPASKVPHVTTVKASYGIIFHGDIVPDASEISSLDAFINTLPREAVSYIGVAVKDTSPVSMKRADYVRAYIMHKGYSGRLFYFTPVENILPDTVMLTIAYSKAVPPAHCPDWTKNPVADYNNTDASNFGCAYYNDFIVQLADPADYDGGRGAAKFDAPRDSVYMQRYLSGTSSSAASGSSGSTPSSSGTTTTTTSSP